MGECPERQRGRTVNPLAMPSQVRVLLPPPLPFRLNPEILSLFLKELPQGAWAFWVLPPVFEPGPFFMDAAFFSICWPAQAEPNAIAKAYLRGARERPKGCECSDFPFCDA